MNAKDLETLNANVDKVVRIVTRDGESIFAKIMLVSEEEEDVIYQLFSTNREARYEEFDEQPAYAIDFKYIESVESSTAPPPSNRNPSGGASEGGND